MEVSGRLKGLLMILRFRPVLGTGYAAMILAVGAAIHEYGVDLYWEGLVIAGVVVFLLQTFVAHTLNDIVDVEVDKGSPGLGTGGSKVIPLGLLGERDLAVIAAIGVLGAMGLSTYLCMRVGWGIIGFALVGLFVSAGYSLEPLKLGYRPFNEFLTFLPGVTAAAVGAYYVLTMGEVSVLALVVGLLYSFLCMGWFMISRVPDYETDREHDKTTTIVYLGLENAKLMASLYVAVAMIIQVYAGLVRGAWIALGFPRHHTPLYIFPLANTWHERP